MSSLHETEVLTIAVVVGAAAIYFAFVYLRRRRVQQT
jgi:hypothetical protein